MVRRMLTEQAKARQLKMLFRQAVPHYDLPMFACFRTPVLTQNV